MQRPRPRLRRHVSPARGQEDPMIGPLDVLRRALFPTWIRGNSADARLQEPSSAAADSHQEGRGRRLSHHQSGRPFLRGGQPRPL